MWSRGGGGVKGPSGICAARPSPHVRCCVVLRCVAGIQTIDSTQALFLPIGASVSLLVMFFFFDSVQVVFTICTAGETFSFFFLINLTNEVAPSGGEDREGREVSPLCSLLLRSPRDHRVCVPAAADVPVPDQTLLPTEQVSLSFSHSFIHDDDDDLMKACFCTRDLNDQLLYVNPNILSPSLCFCQFFV